VVDPATGGRYWHNIKTNETTHVGADEPDTWISVKDKGTGLTYWHNPVTDETTPVGVPKPPMYRSSGGGLAVSQSQGMPAPYQASTPFRQPPQESLGRSMVSYATLGFGFTMGMVMVRVLLGF